MFTIENVEKFFADQLLKGNWIVRQEIVQESIARARQDVDAYGLVQHSASYVFNGDVGLMASFDDAMGRDLVHLEIAAAALGQRAEARAA